MKKIRKTYSGVVPNGKVLNSRNNSLQDTYSSDYLNRIIPNTNDLGEIVVDDISCKNLLDFNSIIKYNRDLSATPTVGNKLSFYNSTVALQFYIPVKNLRGKTLTYSNNSKYSTYIRIYELDDDYKFIKSISRTGFTIGATASYLCVILKESTAISTTATDIEPQLEKGSVATDYVEHKEFDNAPTTLWTNVNHVNDFANQVVNLSYNISNFKYYEIVYKIATDYNNYKSTGKIPTNCAAILDVAMSANFIRTTSTPSGKTLTIGDTLKYTAYGTTTTIVSNNALIPIQILGYK